jgi:hypothetical protein
MQHYSKSPHPFPLPSPLHTQVKSNSRIGQIPIDLFPADLSNFSLVHEAPTTMVVSYREALAIIALGLFSSVLKVCSGYKSSSQMF